MPTRTSAVVAWWLGDGDEECPHCGELYIYELEFRCSECDAAGCKRCVATHVEGHHICVTCAQPGETHGR
jgi:hypothetical protein